MHALAVVSHRFGLAVVRPTGTRVALRAPLPAVRRRRAAVVAGLLTWSAPVSAQTFSDFLAPVAPHQATFYYFTCSYTAYHFDDYGALSIDVLVEALDPDGRVLASERRGEGSGQLFLDVIAAVPVAELSSREYACRSFPFVPSAPERWTSGPIGCQDTRNDVLREYAEHGVSWIPGCGDFDSGGGTAHFSWAEWAQDSGGHGWALARIWSQLEDWRAEYDRGGINLTSGYRCPHVNAAIPGAAPNSRHVYGDAADAKSAEHPWNYEEWTLLWLAARRAGSTWQSSWDDYADRHLHADWR